MVRLEWDNEDSPMYQAGVSQGVFYGDDGVGHAWTGLISVTEKPQANVPTAVYNAMGQKYDIFGNVAEKKHGLACYIYPEVMDEYLGYEYLETFGFIADERPPKKFHMAYRVELGDGLYEIHVLLNQIATFGETARQTITSITAPSTITMNLEGAVDPRIGTSHIVLDSRIPLTKSAEALLFGDEYTDANINSFLAAEPVWETVGANYAPIIEPDYDNMVWLGGENLFTPDNYSQHSNTAYFPNNTFTSAVIEVEPFTTYTITIKNKQTNRLGIYQDPLVDGMHSNYVNKTILSPPDFTQTTKGLDYVRTVTTTDAGRYMIIYLSNQGGNEHTDLIKVELGSKSTPWTPAPTDPDQKPRALDPYPDNYRPGIKNSSNWISNNGIVQVFYDEDRKGIGLYSNTTIESLNTYSDVYWDDITPHISIHAIPRNVLNGRSVYASAKVTMIDPLSDLISSRYATIGVGQHGPTADSPPNTRGESDLYVLNNRLVVPVGSEYDSIRLYHGGSSDTETVTFTDIIVARLDEESEFYDVNSKPPNGVRYQRVSTPNGDYTIKQALRLSI